jgi:UDP-N-acetylglucosamine 4,6-dehydratase
MFPRTVPPIGIRSEAKGRFSRNLYDFKSNREKGPNMELNGKSVLITGGTGSFGRKFVEIALARHNPRRIIVFSRDELKQHDMRLKFNDSRISFFVGDVRDRDRLYRAFQADVDVVIHAAALKQVPACEYNPFEAIKTNVLGAQNIIEAAIDCGIPKVIALSTDKAVNPVNLYGATKLCAEKLFVQGNSYAGAKPTRFSCVRYGNVVGSRGSVIPVFLQQRGSGKVTVTDSRMTRFWLTLEQGIEFVVRCIRLMHGGEVFVPRIPSMKILDLVQAIAPTCAIEMNGVRPGEKIDEVLVSQDEARHTVTVGDMFVIKPEHNWWGSDNWKEGKPLPDGFAFISHTNDHWLSIEELQRMVGD